MKSDQYLICLSNLGALQCRGLGDACLLCCLCRFLERRHVFHSCFWHRKRTGRSNCTKDEKTHLTERHWLYSEIIKKCLFYKKTSTESGWVAIYKIRSTEVLRHWTRISSDGIYLPQKAWEPQLGARWASGNQCWQAQQSQSTVDKHHLKNQNTVEFVGLGVFLCVCLVWVFLSSSKLCICPGQVVWALSQILRVIHVLN